MLIRQIANATATLGRPEDMTDEECAPLAVRQELVDGLPCMTSEWQPTEEERQQIAAGGAVWLRVFGHAHPPVMVEAAPFQAQGLMDVFAPLAEAATTLATDCVVPVRALQGLLLAHNSQLVEVVRLRGTIHGMNEAHAAVVARLANSVDLAVLQEQGQVIVPYVLTSAMRAAFHEAHEEYEEGGFDSPDHQWSAMVNAYEVHGGEQEPD